MKTICSILLIFTFTFTYSQKGLTFQEAEKQGKGYEILDKSYKSAVHSDKKLAVFKSLKQQEKLQKAYADFFQGFAIFLKENNFKWGKETRCFNRIYVNKDGKIDYFLYNFSKDQITIEKTNEFEKLLNKFIETHKFPITAKEKFAQCSPIKYSDL